MFVVVIVLVRVLWFLLLFYMLGFILVLFCFKKEQISSKMHVYDLFHPLTNSLFS